MNKTKIDNQTIAHILLDLRQKHHLSQEQLAQTLGVTRQAVSRWEMGISVPNIHTLLLISEQFHVPIDTMLKNQMLQQKTKIKSKILLKELPLFYDHNRNFPVVCASISGSMGTIQIYGSLWSCICRFLSLYFRIPTVHSSGIIHCPDLCRDL